MARSAEVGGAKHDRRRRDQCRARAERAGGGRHHRRAAAAQGFRPVSIHRQRPGPAHRPRPIRQHHRQDRRRWQHRASPRRGPRPARRRRLQHQLLLRRSPRGRYPHLPAPGDQLHRHRRRHLCQDAGTGGLFPQRRGLFYPLRHHALRAGLHPGRRQNPPDFGRAGGAGRAGLPARLARRGRAAGGNSRLADRHLRRHVGRGIFAQ